MTAMSWLWILGIAVAVIAAVSVLGALNQGRDGLASDRTRPEWGWPVSS